MTQTALEWRTAWATAQDLWGVRLHDPVFVATDDPPSFAWFSFPPEITIDTGALAEHGAEAELESVFAHEIGHHVLAPGTRLGALKIRHQLARALTASDRPVREGQLAMLSNLWSDQLINVRVAELQRRRDPGTEPGMVRLWRRLTRAGGGGLLDWVLRRAYEVCWALPPGTLCAATPPLVESSRTSAGPASLQEVPDDAYAAQERNLRAAQAAREAAESAVETAVVAHPEADAMLLARLVRLFTTDPVTGALSFGMLVAPYLPRENEGSGELVVACGGEPGAAPATAAELGAILGDPRLATSPTHPATDPRVTGAEPTASSASNPGGGQGYGVAETLALYPDLDPGVVLAAWYRTAASRWVRPLTERRPATGGADLPGPLGLWEAGDDLADLDWPTTLTASPEIVPGVTTRRRTRIDDPEAPAEASVQLDLYIDSSGSMPDPQRGSPAVLAGTILALSVLRGGGTVRVTSWASPGQVAGPERFSRDPVEVIAAIAYFFAGGTSFPLDLLQLRYQNVPPASDSLRRHLVVLSDDGLLSMFGVGNEPFAGVAAAVRPAFTTATLVVIDANHLVALMAARAGYEVVYLGSMQDAPATCAKLAEVIHAGQA